MSIQQGRELEYNKRLAERSIEELSKNLEKKIMTTGIAAIAEFEAIFGMYWGHNLKPEQRTENQCKLYEIWQKCRDNILNRTNKEKRAIPKILAPYEIKWKGYQINFRSLGNEQE